MDANASQQATAHGNEITGRKIDPALALAAKARANEAIFFGELASDVPLLVGALAVDRTRRPTWERHDHGDEALVVLSGRFTMTIRDPSGAEQRHEAKAGDVLLIPRGSAHRAELHSETASAFFLTPRSGTREWSDGETPPALAPPDVASSANGHAPANGAPADDAHDDAAAAPFAALMQYKQWADEHLLEALLARPDLEAEPHAVLIREVIGHYHAVDRIFQAHLQGVAHGFTGTRLPETATFAQLRDEVARVDRWFVDYARSIDRDALAERLSVRFTDGAIKTLTRADVLHYIAQHGTYHRGNVGVLMRMLGLEPAPDRVIDYLDERASRG